MFSPMESDSEVHHSAEREALSAGEQPAQHVPPFVNGTFDAVDDARDDPLPVLPFDDLSAAPAAHRTAEPIAVETLRKEGIIARLLTALRAPDMRALDEAITLHPDAPVNYIVRGELYLRAGRCAQAAVDFQHALALAAAQFERDDWGVMAQALRDRAFAGLKDAEACMDEHEAAVLKRTDSAGEADGLASA